METALGEFLAEAPVFVRTFSGTITYWTKGAEHFYGYSWEQAVGQISHDLLKTGFPDPLEEINARLLKERVWNGLLQHCRKDGMTLWTQSHWRIKGEGSDPNHLSVVETNLDVTAREVLSRELGHRLKNTLAIVRALTQLSLKSCSTEDVKSLNGRLEALSLSQDLLMSHHWEYGELGELIEQILSSFGVSDRVDVKGEYAALKPSSVFAYTLAVHELLTNALKYGALSVPSGRVRIAWSLLGDANDKIHLVWREIGGLPS